MSSLVKRNGTIVLFVAGLGYDGQFFDVTIEKLIERTSLFPDDYKDDKKTIDMNYFNIIDRKFFELKNGYLVESSNHLLAFSFTIAEIIAKAKEDVNRCVYVETFIDKSLKSPSFNGSNFVYYDSIEAQSIKLQYIINAIKSIDLSIDIFLVGHSQGGLVNLKTAVDIPNMIKGIISISTPYSAVTIGKVFSLINNVATLFDLNIYSFIIKDPENVEKYDARVDTLSDSSFFNNLKHRWNELKKRPKLVVIAGISAHIMTSAYLPPFEINDRYPFDGLVLGKEQFAIEHCDKYLLHDKNVHCYENSNGFSHSCGKEMDIINEHRCDCPIPCFDVSNVIFRTAIEEISNLFHEGKFINLNETPMIKAFVEGIKGLPLSNSSYKQYYDIFNSPYSHKNIVTTDEAIGLIIGAIKR